MPYNHGHQAAPAVVYVLCHHLGVSRVKSQRARKVELAGNTSSFLLHANSLEMMLSPMTSVVWTRLYLWSRRTASGSHQCLLQHSDFPLSTLEPAMMNVGRRTNRSPS